MFHLTIASLLRQALVRYATENEANTAWEKAESEAEDKKVKFGEAELTAQILEGL